MLLISVNASNMNHGEVKNIDYGWRLNGRPILFYKDRSLAADESTHQMEKALRQMSMEYYALDRCLQCGICSSFCPNNLLKMDIPFSPRAFIQKTRLGLLDLDGDDLWMCTNCGYCQMVCPFEIPLLNVMASLRNLVVEHGAGHLPFAVKASLSSISSCGNPWKEEAAGRVKWLEELDVISDTVDETNTVHIFLGCLAGYDHRVRKTAEAAMRILRFAGISFKVFADEEVCCGDTVYRVGDFSTAEKVKTINKKVFQKNHVSTLYVLSPHCFSTFQDMSAKETVHEVQTIPLLKLVYDLIKSGVLRLKKYENQRITYHDPCFFSKHLNLIDLPREILGGMQGMECVEMQHTGKNSLCCGGGGGGMWRDAKKGERLSEIRLDEALDVEAGLLITGCPYCLSMLEDARRGDAKYRKIEITDIFELIEKGIDYENN